MGQPEWVRPARVMHDRQLQKVVTSSSNFVLGVLRLYGNPIESRFHLYECGG